jgi:hypothetical protein
VAACACACVVCVRGCGVRALCVCGVRACVYGVRVCVSQV